MNRIYIIIGKKYASKFTVVQQNHEKITKNGDIDKAITIRVLYRQNGVHYLFWILIEVIKIWY